jgi:hypothetical protein
MPLVTEHPNSSQLIKTEYEPQTGTMVVTFRYQNSVYVYSGVKPQMFEGLSSAKSAGSFFHQYIKPYHRGQRVK